MHWLLRRKARPIWSRAAACRLACPRISTRGSANSRGAAARGLCSTPQGRPLPAPGCGMFLIKASLRELEGLAGHSIQSEGAQETAARDVVAQGRAEIFVVSLGAQGALLATAEGVRRFAAVPIDGQSSVGAGDSMVAGIVLGLVRGLALDEAVKFGMAAGAATLLRPGTELCRREDAEELYREMAAT